jgi:hypothetical protein
MVNLQSSQRERRIRNIVSQGAGGNPAHPARLRNEVRANRFAKCGKEEESSFRHGRGCFSSADRAIFPNPASVQRV